MTLTQAPAENLAIENRMKLNKYALGLTQLDLKTLSKVMLGRCFSVHHYYAVMLNLALFNYEKKTRFWYRLQKAGQDEIESILDKVTSVDVNSKRALIGGLLFYEAGLKNCYVLKSRKDEIICMQWIIYPSENKLLQKNYPRRYLNLSSKQVMLERGFTFPHFRGLGFMPAITVELLNKAKNEGYTNAVGYIRKDVITSLNEWLKLGFRMRKIITEYRILGYTKRML